MRKGGYYVPISSIEKTKARHFPEFSAGGFSRADGTIEFYGRINALLEPEMTVLDYGAGRGQWIQEDPVSWRRSLQILKGKCAKVIGVDVDQAIFQHPELDEAYLLPETGQIPLADNSVDMIVSDAVFEHIKNPRSVAEEFLRTLKPGGWLCARTPNRWGYIGLGANIVPNALHGGFLEFLQPTRKRVDIFPTVYRANTRRSLDATFPPSVWQNFSYTHFSEPAYFGSSSAAWSLVKLLFRFTPPQLGPTWMIFMRKR